MYETILQETTGVKVYREEEKIMNIEECSELYGKIEEFTRTKKDKHTSKKQVSEIYFSGTEAAYSETEEFLISVEQIGKKKTFTLKRKNYSQNYGSEKKTKITKNQYLSIMQGKMEWMKESGKILLNEFYCKAKIFQYKIGKIVKCIREEIYLGGEELLITVDHRIQKFFYEKMLGEWNGDGQKAYVKVRCSEKTYAALNHNQAMSELLS